MFFKSVIKTLLIVCKATFSKLIYIIIPNWRYILWNKDLLEYFSKIAHTSPFVMRFHLVALRKPRNKTSVNHLPFLVAVIKNWNYSKCWNLKFIVVWLNHLIHYVQYEQYFTACSSSFWNPAFSSFEINHNIMHPKLRYTYEIIILQMGSKGCMFYIVLSTVFHFTSSEGWGRWTPCSTYPFTFLILVK